MIELNSKTLDPIITCPNCGTEIKLTESLAAPLVDTMRKQFEQQLYEMNKEIAKREENIHEKARQLDLQEKSIEEKILHQVSERLKVEKKHLIEIESERARAAFALELDEKSQAIKDMEGILKARDEKLAEAHVVVGNKMSEKGGEKMQESGEEGRSTG